MSHGTISDDDLVAYLDGLASEDMAEQIRKTVAENTDLAVRLDGLRIDTNGLRLGFDAVLSEAPAIPVPDGDSFSGTAEPKQSGSRRWQLAAAAALIFAFGLGSGWALKPAAPPANWHKAVADYQALYSTATLTNLALPEDQRALSLSRTSQDLGLILSLDQVTVEGLSFQRAQILAFEGEPLAQLTYLDRSGNPIAFCLMRTGIDEQPKNRQIGGMNAVTWARGGMGFILIGPATTETLEAAQKTLAAQITL